MGKKRKKIDSSSGGTDLSSNPFGSLDVTGLPNRNSVSRTPANPVRPKEQRKSRGRVDVLRQRSAGSGGWMTVAKNFVGISVEEKNALKKTIQKRCGVGGTLKNGAIEIQGDKRDQVREVLESAGFQVVFAGG